ncbi:MAG TPA: ScyD/ScyE family protein [Vicinamibacterales bacterium]|nr:ScyD/ScyE family protein [Vicinamibacterales bacterium]
MNRRTRHLLLMSVSLSLALVVSDRSFTRVQASVQCSELTSGLNVPLGVTLSNQSNLIVGESGTGAALTGRLSIVDLDGNRRTLLNGLPSALNDVGDPSGPAGVFMRGRTLYLAIGIGDSIRPGGPGVAFANPTPSSPLFSSILAIHFSAGVEKQTGAFTLTSADHLALASGEKVTLSNGGGKITIELIVNFPNFTPNPAPPVPGNVRGSNPFDLVVVGNQIYVTDGGQNSVREVDIPTGSFSTLVTFPNIGNPFFPGLGGPFVEAVPTGIAYADGRLLVTLFRGFPFPPGFSVVEQVDPVTGSHGTLISGRTAAIDVLQTKDGSEDDHLVLQFASGPVLSGAGLLLQFDNPGSAPTTIAGCLTAPSSMALDEKSGTVYVTELTGRIVAISIPGS